MLNAFTPATVTFGPLPDDVAVTNVNGVNVLLGNGDGTFQAAITYSTGGSGPDSVAIADVNGDGAPDLVVANSCASSSSCAGSVAVLLGTGKGAFGAAVTYSSGGAYARSIAVGDVNGDGKPDLVVANNCADSASCASCCEAEVGIVGILIGNGNGSFEPAVVYSSGGYYAESVAVGDVNEDGKADLVVRKDHAAIAERGKAGVRCSPFTEIASGQGLQPSLSSYFAVQK